MTAMTGNWIAIGRLADIPRRGARRIAWGSRAIAVFRTLDDGVFALEDRCPHRGGPLSEGIVHDGCVTCPLHGFVIALDTGEAQGADDGRVRRFRTRLTAEGAVLLDADDLAAPDEARDAPAASRHAARDPDRPAVDGDPPLEPAEARPHRTALRVAAVLSGAARPEV